MKHLTLVLTFALCSLAASAQTQSTTESPNSPKLDSLTKLSQRYLNNNQPDSLYALMGPAFKQQISLDKTKEIMGQFAGQLGKWISTEPRGVKDGVARYKATFSLASLDFFISHDKDGKIETFLFKPLE